MLDAASTHQPRHREARSDPSALALCWGVPQCGADVTGVSLYLFSTDELAAALCRATIVALNRAVLKTSLRAAQMLALMNS